MQIEELFAMYLIKFNSRTLGPTFGVLWCRYKCCAGEVELWLSADPARRRALCIMLFSLREDFLAAMW